MLNPMPTPPWIRPQTPRQSPIQRNLRPPRATLPKPPRGPSHLPSRLKRHAPNQPHHPALSPSSSSPSPPVSSPLPPSSRGHESSRSPPEQETDQNPGTAGQVTPKIQARCLPHRASIATHRD